MASDLTTDTQRILPYAAEIARRSGATIHVVHVIQPDVYPEMVSAIRMAAKMAQAGRNIPEKKKRGELDVALQEVPHQFHFPARQYLGTNRSHN